MAALRNRLVLCLVWIVFASPARGEESPATLSADIGPQPLAEALAAFGRQTGLQLIYVSSVAETQRSKGAQAGLAASAALAQLLDGTGLRFEFLNARTVRIFPAPAASPTAIVLGPDRQRYAERSAGLEEVVVTATRREERQNHVPIAMAVWTQEAMEASGIKGMAQIGALTPGVDFGFRPGTGGDFYTDVAIRGVSNRHGSTTSIYLDDAQIPPTRVTTYADSFPLTFDLDRVEVLRGPQSTLLGDHTQGGAVRFITNQPSLTTFSGLARTEWSTTAHGGISYEAGAAAGGPIVSDVLGFRVSGWYRADGGYVDRVNPYGATVDANANRYMSKTVRGALMFAPDESVRITPSLTYQSTYTHDTATFYIPLSNPAAEVLRNGSLIQQPFDDSFYLVSLKITAGLRVGELTSVTSYYDLNAAATLDNNQVIPPLPSTLAVAWDATQEQRTYSQEVRLTSADPNGALTWIAGAFLSHDHTHQPQWQVESGFTDFVDAIDIGRTQISGFGQLAVRVTRRLTASAGVRIGRSKFDYSTEAPPTFHGAAADSWVTPRFVLSYQADAPNLIYLTVAKGYGSGGVYPGFIPFAPQPYPPDTLWSYEIGSKTDLLDGRVHLDASLFHIRWNNGPPDFNLVTGEQDPVPGTANSNGFDLAVQAFLSDRVKAALGVSYVDARYAQTLTLDGAVFVRKGDSVGGSPWSATASIERDFSLRDGVTASVRAEDVFHSRNPGPLVTENPASPFYNGGTPPSPSTNVLNLRADVKRSSFDVAAFVSNALNSQPTLSAGNFGTVGTAVTLTPRTVGVSASWRH